MKKGKFIVVEGIDGSGKSTQSDLLSRRLKRNGFKVFKIDFPRYGTKSAGLVEEYLKGRYGRPLDVGPYRASIFYACDRYAAASRIRKKLADGFAVISDRYTASNIGHQGGKIKNCGKWNKFVNWLFELEYKIFQIPKPDLTIILKTNPLLAHRMALHRSASEKRRRIAVSIGKKSDVHEADIYHLEQALLSYIRIAEKRPKEYKIIECLKEDGFLAPAAISEKIWEAVRKIL